MQAMASTPMPRRKGNARPDEGEVLAQQAELAAIVRRLADVLADLRGVADGAGASGCVVEMSDRGAIVVLRPGA